MAQNLISTVVNKRLLSLSLFLFLNQMAADHRPVPTGRDLPALPRHQLPERSQPESDGAQQSQGGHSGITKVCECINVGVLML